ncbi:MAG: hypothetical protein II530_04285 [Bacteroidaceae bacterium]|jgi:hypothetical protein|nr:hypothetical protein [Bacteroidaceae bacterium]
MGRATKHLNRNKQFLIGIGVLAFAVLLVVVLFLSMSYDKLEEQMKVVTTQGYYQIEFEADIVGESAQVYVNDSLLFDGEISSDSLKIRFRPFGEQHLLMMVDKKSDIARNFNLQEKACKVLVRKNTDGKFIVDQINWENK